MNLVDALRTRASVVAAELRPPRAELSAHAGLEAWIDTYHAVRSLVRQDAFVFVTDSAVGSQEEDNLRHLVANLGDAASRSHVAPFLTAKHSLDYCLSYADRAWQHGFPALVVLGGDKSVGVARCVDHAWQLRARIHERQPQLRLGGWANPHRDAVEQVAFLLDERGHAEFYLTQVVSHHHLPSVERFLEEASRQSLAIPGVFGVFFYRSANPRTLAALGQFLPVPVDQLAVEFANGDDAVTVCARTIRQLRSAGVRHFYISNLPIVRTQATLKAILDLASA